ncbi:MAG: hypothetical protein WCH86_02620 [Kiritimatiellales bacterium]
MKKWWILILMAGLCGMAQATVVVNVNQVGSDIVWDWSGSLNTTGATLADTFGGFSAYVRPYYVEMPLYGAPQNTYAYSISGPSFGDLGDGSAVNGFTTKSGNTSFGISSYGSQVWLAQFYTSGSSIYGTNVMANKTLSGIGLNGGTYEWTVTGNGDKITVNVIPEPASALLIGCGGLLVVGYRRMRKSYGHF